jgi:hypothetical protein
MTIKSDGGARDDALGEYHGELVRGEGGFALAAPGGVVYTLDLPRVPVDLFNKSVIVTGELSGGHIVAAYIRERD